MGIGIRQPTGQAHGIHQLVDPFLQFLLGLAQAIYLQGVRNQFRHAVPGIEGGKRVLENELHVPPQLLLLLLGQACGGPPFKEDLPFGGLLESQYGPAQGGFAAARLAHHPEGLALTDGKGYVVHGVEHSRRGTEIFFQMVDFQQFSHGLPPLRRPMRKRSRPPSDSAGI